MYWRLSAAQAQVREQCRRCTDLAARCLAAAHDGSAPEATAAVAAAAAAAHRAGLEARRAVTALAAAEARCTALAGRLDEAEFRLERSSNSVYRLRDRLADAETRARSAVADAASAEATAVLQRMASAGAGGAGDQAGGSLTPQASQELELEL